MTTIADDIWAILHEIAQSQKETDRILKEISAERQVTERERQETQREIKELKIETDTEFKELSRVVKSVSTSIGRLGNRLGEFVEEAVRPSAVRLFRERGIDVHEVHQNVTAKRGGEALEIDLLVVNNSDVIAIECKSNLEFDDVNDHLKRLEKIKRLIPDYKEKRISGAVAGMVIQEDVAAYAIKNGLYVIGQNGEHLELRNDAEFVAKVW